MATWTMSDGTRVHSGGEVEGQSALAINIRARVRSLKDGLSREWVSLRPPPGGMAPLDVNDDWALDHWLRGLAFRYRVDVTEAPALEMPAHLRTDPDTRRDGDIY